MTPELRAAYAHPRRAYHALAHVEACLRELAALDDLSPPDRRLLEAAIWWHDAIYDPTRSDNEARSAELARADLIRLGWTPADADEVARLILLTKGHRTEPGDRLGALLVSIDLSVLGGSAADYDAYVAGVRREYAHVPEPLWRQGRGAVMRGFLEARPLFPDPAFEARLGETARANIARELAALA